MRLALRGVGQEAEPIRAGGVGDPHLGAVDDVVAAFFGGRGLHPRHVRPCLRLAHGDGGDHLSCDRRGEVLTPHVVGAKARQRGRGHVGLHADRQRDAAAGHPAHLLGHHHPIRIVQPHAAKLGRLGHAQEPQVAHLLEDLVDGKAPGVLPLADVGVELLLDKRADGAAQLFVLWRKDHGVSGAVAGLSRPVAGDGTRLARCLDLEFDPLQEVVVAEVRPR